MAINVYGHNLANQLHVYYFVLNLRWYLSFFFQSYDDEQDSSEMDPDVSILKKEKNHILMSDLDK